MQITITQTDTILELDGVPVRLWEGVTAGGVRCKVFVHRVAVAEDVSVEEFERDLTAQEPPKRRPIPLRHII